MLPLLPRTVDIIAMAAAGVAVLALLLAGVALLRQRRLRRSLDVLSIAGETRPVVDIIGQYAADLASARASVAAMQAQVASMRTDVADALRHVAVVRYDAFADMGGRLSFSVAILDDGGDGVVLTSLIGHRTEARVYAKGVKGGGSEHPLSPEEQQAISYALRGAPAGHVPAGRTA